MYEIFIKTTPFLIEFAKTEIFELGFFRAELVGEDFLKFEVNSNKDLLKVFENLVYYSRCIKNIYLKIIDFNSFSDLENKNLNLNFINKIFSYNIFLQDDINLNLKTKISKLIEKSNSNLQLNSEDLELKFNLLNISDKNYLFLDLIGFDLNKRDYKLNFDSSKLDSLICNYLFYSMQIDKEKSKFSIIDPISNFGDCIIEASLFNPKIALNVKKKDQIIFSKIFNSLNFPIPIKVKNKYLAIVQDNNKFKSIKENISYSSSKIKVSQYDLDYLDVKFISNQIDYMVINTPNFSNKNSRDEFISQLLYMVEFMVKKRMGIISRWKIEKEIIKKNKLKIRINNQIDFNGIKYYIYVLIH